jgi:hypothetical protein
MTASELPRAIAKAFRKVDFEEKSERFAALLVHLKEQYLIFPDRERYPSYSISEIERVSVATQHEQLPNLACLCRMLSKVRRTSLACLSRLKVLKKSTSSFNG